MWTLGFVPIGGESLVQLPIHCCLSRKFDVSLKQECCNSAIIAHTCCAKNVNSSNHALFCRLLTTCALIPC